MTDKNLPGSTRLLRDRVKATAQALLTSPHYTTLLRVSRVLVLLAEMTLSDTLFQKDQRRTTASIRRLRSLGFFKAGLGFEIFQHFESVELTLLHVSNEDRKEK